MYNTGCELTVSRTQAFPPVFVACSTTAGEGLVTLIMCNDISGCVEEWHIPSVQL